jgi:N-formylglutamate deformylase
MQLQNKAAASPTPVVLDSPHSGREYPPDFDFACPLERLRKAEDFLVDELFAFAPELGAPLLCAPFPRSYIDVNRAPDDIDPELLAAEDRHGLAPSAKSLLGMGLVWRLLDDGKSIYRRPLTRAAIDERIAAFWHPYHAALAQLISTAHQRHGYSVHLNCHSMPSRSRLYPVETAQTMPFDFLVGDRDGATSSPALTQRVATLLRSEGFTVGVNEIFKGVELVRRHGNPGDSRHSIQLEINRKLYMDEERLAPHDGFSRVQSTLRRLVESLITVIPHTLPVHV